MRILLLLLLTFNLHASTCTDLSNKLLTSKVHAHYYHHPETRLADGQVEAVVDSRVIAFLTYTNHFDYHYIEVVRVDRKFRRKGIHSEMFRRFVNQIKPKEIHFKIGSDNRDSFIENIGIQLFPSMQHRYKFTENYLVSIIDTPMLDDIKFELFISSMNTPSGKALRRLGYEPSNVNISTYDMRGRKRLKIGLEFTKE